jgi:hypothetical protein
MTNKSKDANAAVETAVVVREEAGLPGMPEELTGFTGFEGIDPGSVMIIPRIKLVQGTSKEGTAGRFRINLTGEEFDSLPIIVIKAIQARTMWDPDPNNEEVLCRSYDFLVPDVKDAAHPNGSIEKPFAPVCAKKVKNARGQEKLLVLCPQGKWRKDEKGNDVKPECAEVYNLLCLMDGDFLPFWMSISGASIGGLRGYLSAIALRRTPLFYWSATLTSEIRTEPKKHHVAKFGVPYPIDKTALAQIGRIITDLDLQNADIRRTDEAEDMGGGAGDAGGESGPDDEQPPTPDFMKEKK